MVEWTGKRKSMIRVILEFPNISDTQAETALREGLKALYFQKSEEDNFQNKGADYE